ncbi:MAG: phosphate/phosphite/phosphonate ABC transporter substrate-binding protein [Gemmataceae bacterium]
MGGMEPARFSWRNVVVATLLLGIPVLGFFAWQSWSMSQAEKVDYARWFTGYIKRSGPLNHLDARFKDENSDLVADAPADPGQLLDPAELVFAPIASSSRDTEDTWREFLAHLSKVTGKKVKFTSFEEHRPQIAGLLDGTLHVTGFGTGLVPVAVNSAGFVPQVALAKADGTFNYQMEIVVPADSPIQKIENLKDSEWRRKNLTKHPDETNPKWKLTVTGSGSHSGFKAPLIFLKDEYGLHPGNDYDFVFSGGHAQSLKAIANKHAQAAAVASDLLEEGLADPEIGLKEGQYRVIYQSKPFPKAAFGVPNRLKPELAAKVREAFLSFDFKGTKLEAMLRGSHTEKFTPIDYKKDWAPVRAIDEAMLKWASP